MTSSTTALVPMLAIGQTIFFIACGMLAVGLLGMYILAYWRAWHESKDE
jgi:hypothetical protein